MMIKKKRKRIIREIIIPAGTQQETGVDRFIKKTRLKEIVKDARINNKAELKNKTP